MHLQYNSLLNCYKNEAGVLGLCKKKTHNNISAWPQKISKHWVKVVIVKSVFLVNFMLHARQPFTFWPCRAPAGSVKNALND